MDPTDQLTDQPFRHKLLSKDSIALISYWADIQKSLENLGQTCVFQELKVLGFLGPFTHLTKMIYFWFLAISGLNLDKKQL